jgi:NAD(P)-dependent dehydrogenase (short-subunit alcohol dehydrogenase family)
MNLSGATALVTGANRGLGRELVRTLLSAGAARVYAGARDPAKLADLVATSPDRIKALRVDVTDHATVAALPAQAPDVKVLVNNAGVLHFGRMADVALEAIEQDMAVNFYGKLAMARTFAPVIESNGGGAIVNVLTLLSMVSAPVFSAYNVSKAAAWSMTQSLRAELAGKGISVVSVFPGGIDTDMLAGVEAPKTPPSEVATAIVEGIRSGLEDIYPDPMSTQVYAAWKQDHKAVEKQFAAMM